ncbi:MAG: SDR family oxidoreductase [Eggerthellaceae bacterium]|jgi:short-subunit dehydrogenase
MGKTVLITGATGGLGEAFARVFAHEGYDLLLVARDQQKLDTLARLLTVARPVEVKTLAIPDLASPGAAARVVEFTEREHTDVDVLVNNAGFGDYGPFAESSLDRQIEMIDLNVRTLTELTYWYLGPMLDRDEGRILNVASVAAFMPGPLMSTYFATKAYVLSFSEALATELKHTGVTCTALCPGPTSTGFWNAAGTQTSSLFSSISYASPDDVARFGFISMMNGRAVAIPGAGTRLLAHAVRLLPRSVVRNATYALMK